MHKLNLITGALGGAALGLGLIGYVQGIITGAELVSLLIALAAGGVVAIALTERGQ